MNSLSSYNSSTGQIWITPGASQYVHFHEKAHKEQHESRSIIWRLWWYGRYIRGVNWLVTLLVEYDAYCRARRALEQLGQWSQENEAEARANLRTYITQKPAA